MFHPVSDGRRALSAQALKLSRAGARDNDIGLLRQAALEHSSALEPEAARSPYKTDDSLEADERRAVAAIIRYSTALRPRCRRDARHGARVSFAGLHHMYAFSP